MFKKRINLVSKREELSNYVEGADLYNSELLTILNHPKMERTVQYVINTHEFRPDLIAKDIYGSEEYMGILMLQLGFNLEDFYRGRSIYVIPKNKLDKIIFSL